MEQSRINWNTPQQNYYYLQLGDIVSDVEIEANKAMLKGIVQRNLRWV